MINVLLPSTIMCRHLIFFLNIGIFYPFFFFSIMPLGQVKIIKNLRFTHRDTLHSFVFIIKLNWICGIFKIYFQNIIYSERKVKIFLHAEEVKYLYFSLFNETEIFLCLYHSLVPWRTRSTSVMKIWWVSSHWYKNNILENKLLSKYTHVLQMLMLKFSQSGLFVT